MTSTQDLVVPTSKYYFDKQDSTIIVCNIFFLSSGDLYDEKTIYYSLSIILVIFIFEVLRCENLFLSFVHIYVNLVLDLNDHWFLFLFTRCYRTTMARKELNNH